MKVAIIGIGLLGGSLALALRYKYPKMHFIGVDTSVVNKQLALARGIIDEVQTLDNAVAESTLVIISTPVNIIVDLINPVFDHLQAGATVIDIGSTKKIICSIADTHLKRDQFVATHPMAGTEDSGPSAAYRELLYNKNLIICNREKSNFNSLSLVESLFRDIGMKLFYMTPEEHDLHLAYVSHLSHISAFALGLTVLQKEKDEQTIFDVASTGFSSTVRLAKSSPQMWAPIFDHNRLNLSSALSTYINLLKQFKQALDSQDIDTSLNFMHKANVIREVLQGIDK